MKPELMTEFFRLSKLHDIPNMERYAQEWYILARRFEMALFPAMAAACHGRWQQYMPMQGGHYIRVSVPPFAELQKVA